jgi:hypothetical protein
MVATDLGPEVATEREQVIAHRQAARLPRHLCWATPAPLP